MRTCVILLAGLIGLIGVQPAQAQAAFGPQAAWSDDFDLGVGGRVELGLGSMLGVEEGAFADLVGMLSGTFFFPDCAADVDCSFFELDPNAAIAFPVEGSVTPYAGAGLHIARLSTDVSGVGDVSDTEVGLNILGGVKLPLGGTAGFAEGKLGLAGAEHFTITAGVLFGGR